MVNRIGGGKFLQLQGVRGLAMLGIFKMHTRTFWSDNGFGILNTFADDLGRSCVIVFFMLSGFLLTFRDKQIPVLSWTSRIKACSQKFHKLYFLYVITLVVAFFGYERMPQSVTDWVYAIISLPLCLTYTQDLIPHVGINISYNGPAWYISALFIIWIIAYSFPGKINAINRLGSRQCLIAIFVVVAMQIAYKIGEHFFPTQLIPINHSNIYMSWISYFSPFYNFGFFIMGCFIGRLAFLAKSQRTIWLRATILLALLIVAYSLHGLCFFKYAKPILAGLFIGCLLFSTMQPDSLIARIVSFKPIVWFGNISASFFLIHGVVNYMLRYLETDISKPLLFFISFFISIVLSVISEKYLILQKNESILQHINKAA